MHSISAARAQAFIGGALQSTLRRYAKPRVAQERCELCRQSIGPEHRHLLEVAHRKIVCSCDACALRFTDVVGGRFKLIPRDTQRLEDFHMTDVQWAEFLIPINLVFLFESTPAQKVVALYPSAAGATESLLSLSAWNALKSANSVLNDFQADVEALLINRVGESRAYYRAPIDKCFELVGLIRTHWRGLSGGEKVWAEVSQFFQRLDGSATNGARQADENNLAPEVAHA